MSLLSVVDLWYVLATAGDPHFPLAQTASAEILNNGKCFFKIVSGKGCICDLDFNSVPNANTATSLTGAFQYRSI